MVDALYACLSGISSLTAHRRKNQEHSDSPPSEAIGAGRTGEWIDLAPVAVTSRSPPPSAIDQTSPLEVCLLARTGWLRGTSVGFPGRKGCRECLVKRGRVGPLRFASRTPSSPALPGDMGKHARRADC